MGGSFARWSEALLDRVGVDPAADRDRSFDLLRRLLLIAVAVESWNALRYAAYQEQLGLHTLLAAGLSLCVALGWPRRSGRAACALAAVLLASGVALAFPFNANHQFVELLCLGFVVLADSDAGDARQTVLQAVRWLLLIGIFWAGLQKLLWGYYFGGEFLAQRLAIDPAFAAWLKPIVPAGEWERLRALEAAPGAGPYRVDSALFVVVSNLAWLSELVLPVLLLVRRTRRVAVVLGLLLFAAIEAGARELYFGALVANLLLLFGPAALYARAFPVFVVAYAYLLAVALGWLPRWSFG